MSRPVTLFTIQWGDLPLEEMCRLAKQMGYEGLELSAAHLDMKKAAEDPAYVQSVKDMLKKYDLGCWAISNHLAGQCVIDTLPDAYDSRLDGFAPAECAGKPEEIQKTICQVGPQDMSHPEFYMKSTIGTQHHQRPQFSHSTNGKKVCSQGK